MRIVVHGQQAFGRAGLERLLERGHELELSEEAKQFLIRKGSNLDYGARPLRRALENYIEDPLSEELLKGEFQGKNRIVVDGVANDKGKIKRLEFVGEWVEPAESEAKAVSVGAGEQGEDEQSSDD